jgi:hypothetical protein
MRPDLTPLAPAMGMGELFDVQCIVEPVKRKENSVYAHSLGLPVCTYREPHRRSLAIVASGPSAGDYVEQLKSWTGEIWGINGAFNWMLGQGIDVDAFVGMDPEPILIDYLKDTPQNATYYVANQCDPSIFGRLKGQNVKLWHIADPAVPPPIGTRVIPGGSTCLCRAPYLAAMLGFEDVHIFGGDSSQESEGYVYGGFQKEAICYVEVDAVTYTTNRQMLAQALEMVELFKNFPGTISIYGRGLLPAMAADAKKVHRFIQKKARKIRGLQAKRERAA